MKKHSYSIVTRSSPSWDFCGRLIVSVCLGWKLYASTCMMCLVRVVRLIGLVKSVMTIPRQMRVSW